MRLKDKVALVTGATYGIGATIAERMAEEGASVVFVGRSIDKGMELQKKWRDAGLEVTFTQCDVSKEEDIKKAISTAVDTYGKLTTVVNNAAATDISNPGGGDSHVLDITDEAFDQVLRVGIKSVLWSSKHAIPHLQAAGGGAIINISAASSVRAMEGRPAYQASKGAVNSLTRQIAVDYGPTGIRSNAIIVGFTPTGGEIINKMVANEQFITAVKRCIPAPRLGKPRDIAGGCIYLASDEGEYVNGVLLPIDGGFTAKLAIPDTSALSSIGE